MVLVSAGISEELAPEALRLLALGSQLCLLDETETGEALSSLSGRVLWFGLGSPGTDLTTLPECDWCACWCC